jgi:glycine/D-amino acid oxidase-like deaminating enzyme
MKATGGIFHPAFKAMPYWWEAWRPAEEPPVDLPATTPVAIIGGGYAGLNAVLELARNGTDSVVLEANDFGFGASTRSGGAVSGGINLGNRALQFWQGGLSLAASARAAVSSCDGSMFERHQPLWRSPDAVFAAAHRARRDP